MLLVAMLMSLFCGTMYAFGSFETELKAKMNWSQTEIQMMGVAMHVGTYAMKPFCGALLDSAGAQISAAVAAGLSFTGYSVVSWCVMDGRDGSALPAFCFFLVGIASAQGYVTALSISITNFPIVARGKVVGAIASMFGVSATVVSVLYSNASMGLAGFFFLFACLMGGSNLLGCLVLRKIPHADDVDPEVELQPFEELSMEESPVSSTTPTTPKVTLSSLPEGRERLTELPLSLTDAVREICADPPYRLLYVTFGISCGAGLFVINNLGLMNQSLSGSPEEDKASVERLVISLSICNMLGRLLAGQMMDAGFKGNVLLGLSSLAISASCLSSALIPEGSQRLLLLTSIVTGLGYGGLWAVCPTMMAERYGVLNFGKTFGVVTTAPALTSFLANELIASHIYEASADEGTGICLGQTCYMGSFLLMGLGGLASALMTLWIRWDPQDRAKDDDCEG